MSFINPLNLARAFGIHIWIWIWIWRTYKRVEGSLHAPQGWRTTQAPQVTFGSLARYTMCKGPDNITCLVYGEDGGGVKTLGLRYNWKREAKRYIRFIDIKMRKKKKRLILV